MNVYLKHPTLGNGHFPVAKLLEMESQGWVWWPHGEHKTRPASVPVFVPVKVTPPEPPQPVKAEPKVEPVEVVEEKRIPASRKKW